MFRLKFVVVLFTLTLTLGLVKCSNKVVDSNELWIGEHFDELEPDADGTDFGDQIPVADSENVDDFESIENGQNFNVFEAVAQPDLTFLRPFQRKPSTIDVSPRLSFTYTLGARVNGDRLLVRYKSPRTDSSTPLDIKQSETFEFEAYLTYVQVVVDQSTNESKVNLKEGGEGQRNITLETEATHTLYFNYTTEIYGYY